MRIAVLGAGAAGLCAGRQSSHLADVTKLVIYEQTSSVGGTWVYTDKVGADEHGLPIHSSMYKDMRTNLPVETMQFPDYPWHILPNEKASFVSHRSVLRYLEEYTDHFGFRNHIRFNTHVKEIRRTSESWAVESQNLATKETQVDDFDSVFICNGHYSHPKILDCHPYKALEVLHSHDYRRREAFAGKTVACLGSGPSGIDISIELAAVCPQVYLCHNQSRIQSPLPDNVQQKYGFTEYHDDYIQLADGDHIKPDVIIYCTGYHYSFPFLESSNVVLNMNEDRLTPLYQHLVHIDHPSLFFIGLPNRILPFPLFHVQIQFALALLQGKISISKAEMLQWQTDDYEQRTKVRKLPHRKSHFLGDEQWLYTQHLCDLAGFPNPIQPYVKALYTAVHYRRLSDVVNYKNMRFEVLDEQTFRDITN